LAALAALLDKKKRAVVRARFSAWWNGEDYRPPGEGEAEAPADGTPSDSAAAPAKDAASDTAPRLEALTRLWGEGRSRPGDETAETLMVAALEPPAEATITVLGPGLAAPLLTFAKAHEGPIRALEWREETLQGARAALAEAELAERVTLDRVDLDTFAPSPESVDVLISLDDFTYAANAPRLAQQITKALKPGARALIETYAANPTPAIAPAFASSFAEHHLRPAGDLQDLFVDAGLSVEASEDLSETHAELGRQGFKRLEAMLETATQSGIQVRVLQEIAWEATAWKERIKLLAQRRLERRRFVLRKPEQA